MLRSTILAPLAVFLMTGAGSAETLTYNCKMTDLSRGGGWIPTVSQFRVDTSAKTVKLLRPTEDQMKGHVKSTKLVRNNADKLMVRWVFGGMRSDSNQTSVGFKYRTAVEKATGDAEVIFSVVGYRNTYRATGKCTVK